MIDFGLGLEKIIVGSRLLGINEFMIARCRSRSYVCKYPKIFSTIIILQHGVSITCQFHYQFRFLIILRSYFSIDLQESSSLGILLNTFVVHPSLISTVCLTNLYPPTFGRITAQTTQYIAPATKIAIPTTQCK